MRKLFKEFYYNTRLGRMVISPFFKLINIILSQEKILELRFQRMLGYKLNLSNPKSFNEKIQWLKLNDRSSLHTICADKYAVRNYISKKLGKDFLIPLVLVTDKIQEIKTKNFPDYPVIVKLNNGSGGVTIIKNKNNINFDDLQKKLIEQLHYDYNITGYGEWQYDGIKSKIIVEKLLLDDNQRIPADYKFFCFNGKAKFVQVDTNRETEHRLSFYSLDWELLPFRKKYKPADKIPKPQNLNAMIESAEKLAVDFIFVRVDLYSLDNNIYFGELTFHPASGFGKFYPEQWDFRLGEMLKIPVQNVSPQ